MRKPAIVKLLLLIYSFQFRSAFCAKTSLGESTMSDVKVAFKRFSFRKSSSLECLDVIIQEVVILRMMTIYRYAINTE